LAQLCREHDITEDLVRQSQDLDQVLDRTLNEFERRIRGADTRPEQLLGLVCLARSARELKSRGLSLEDTWRTERALERVDRQFRDAAVRTRTPQRQLETTMAELVRDAGQTAEVDVRALGELFSTLSRLCHKINNPLTSIMGRAQMLQAKVKEARNDGLGKSVGVIEESSKRVAGLVQELANLVVQGRKEFAESYDSSKGSR
jgi:signal transduction histidine kinase